MPTDDLLAAEHNRWQNVGQSNQRTKVPTIAQRHHKDDVTLNRDAEDRRRCLTEEFVTNLPLQAEDQERESLD